MSLLQMTLSGGAFILFIVVIRALALHRLPKAAFLALWEMAALRLLLPFTIPLPFAIPLPFSALVPVGQLPAAGEHLVVGEVPVLELPDMGIPGTPAPAGTASCAVLPMIWLVGMALMAAYFVVFYVRTRRQFRISTPDDTPAVRRWLAGQRLRRPLEVRQSAQVSSPLTYGILRPVILLPAGMERDDEAALTYILTHEFVHIRRFDGVTKLVFAAALCVHWFNPLAWVLYVLANRDLELSCDERVMDTLGGGEKASYALTLINMAEAQSRRFSPYNHFSKLAIEERIEAIMKYKKASIISLVLALALIVGVTTAFATSASENEGAGILTSASEIEYPINDNGQTYGSAALAQNYDERPDLIAAVGCDGQEGYIYKTDLESGIPKTPAEALAQQQQYEAMAIASEGERVVVRSIPLYDADGKTVIGKYEISFKKSVNLADSDNAGGLVRISGDQTCSEHQTLNLNDLNNCDATDILKNAQPIEITVLSVSHNDEQKFTPDEWSQILDLIDEGKVSWED